MALYLVKKCPETGKRGVAQWKLSSLCTQDVLSGHLACWNLSMRTGPAWHTPGTEQTLNSGMNTCRLCDAGSLETHSSSAPASPAGKSPPLKGKTTQLGTEARMKCKEPTLAPSISINIPGGAKTGRGV
jgi:hypothetical protein